MTILIPKSSAGPSLYRKNVEMNEAARELKGKSEEIGRMVTSMHPLVPKLGDAAAQGEIYKALFELTKQVEVVKKQLLKLEKQDDSTVL